MNMVQAFTAAPKRSTVSANIVVEVAYALPEKQYLQSVLEEGATVEQAIIASGLLALRDDIDLAKNKVGIYSRPVKLHDVVHDGDRVEIYRPLIADPKELRRQRGENAGNSGEGIKKALSERFLLLQQGAYCVRAGLLSMLVNTPLLLKVSVSVCWVTFSCPGC
jgi:putative ubiquitin-RnfH superfamily antitoxin RatB of RatAB toxin-antitoxin module